MPTIRSAETADPALPPRQLQDTATGRISVGDGAPAGAVVVLSEL